MVRSMTGFGEASSFSEGVHYFLEVRSLNGKYFKAAIRMPEDFQGLEPEIDSELRRRLTRGSITVIGKTSDASASAAYRINHQALESYIDQLRNTRQVRDGSCTIDMGALLDLPGVLQPPSDEEERFCRAQAVFKTLLEKACGDLIGMRVREGRLIVDDLLSHHASIVRHLEVVNTRAPLVVEEYRNRLLQRVRSLLDEVESKVEPESITREVTIYAEKSDISEEIARLTGHLDQFRSMLQDSDGTPIGRTLDFLAQEMLREANTIASKSSDVEISRRIVEIKGAIDRIKEQVQNIE